MTIAMHFQIEDMTGYRVDASGLLANAPCGCAACTTGVQPGHVACEQPTDALCTAEAEGLIVRDDGAWHWFAAR